VPLDIEQDYYPIIKELSAVMAKHVSSRVYFCIIDENGGIKYIDEDLMEYKDFIINFTKQNFRLLSIGDYSIPLSGRSVVFFKPAKNYLIILYAKKGLVGELLTFKRISSKLSAGLELMIDRVIPSAENVFIESSSEIEQYLKKELELRKNQEDKPLLEVTDRRIDEIYKPKRVPILVKAIDPNFKMNLDEITILSLCTGKFSIEYIAKSLSVELPKVEKIIKKFEKLGWLKVGMIRFSSVDRIS